MGVREYFAELFVAVGRLQLILTVKCLAAQEHLTELGAGIKDEMLFKHLESGKKYNREYNSPIIHKFVTKNP